MHISDGKCSRWPELFSEGWTWCSSPLLTAKHWTDGFSIPHSRVFGRILREQTESLVTDSCHHGNEKRIRLPMIATCSFQRLQWWVCYYNLTLLVPRHWNNSIKNRTVSRENHVGTEKTWKQFMQSSIAPFLFPLVFLLLFCFFAIFHVGQIPQAPIRKQKCGLMKFINLCYLLPTPSAT